MYSGSESGDSQKLAAQWPLNPAAYQNLSADQVDWAALAQQWIIMKDAGHPPVPGGQSIVAQKSGDIEGGEAPMEVENTNDDAPSWGSGGEAPPAPGAEAWSNWNTGSWGWSNNWSGQVAPPPPPISGKPPPLLPTPTYPVAADDNAVAFSGYSTGPQKNKGSYWNSGTVIQKEIKPHNKRYSKVNVPIKAPVHIPPPLLQTPVAPPADMISDTPTLDAAKRKQLPAWIREGLEKMEKDKLKQMEKEREKQAMEVYKEKAIQSEKERLEVLKNTMQEEKQLQKSRFDSDNEDESDKEQSIKKRNRSPEPPIELTPEEKMMKVRRNMTEILLKTTSRFIEQICREEHQRYIKKRRASAQLGSAPSGAVLSAKLGLGAYGDGSSSSSDSEPEEKDRYQSDSDSELRESIRRKMADFTKIEREIEDRLANVENQKEESISRSSTPETPRGNDSQVDEPVQVPKQHKLESENGPALEYRNRSRSRSSSESSDYKDSKNVSRRKSTSSNEHPKKPDRRDSENHRDRSEPDGRKEQTDKFENQRRRSDSDRDHLEKFKSERRRSSSHRERSDSRTPDRKYKRQSSRYSKTPDRKRRSRSRSSRRDSTESKKKSRRSDESVRSSRRSYRSRKSRSRSRSSSYYRKSSKKSSRRTRTRSRSHDSRRSTKKMQKRHRSRSKRRRSRSRRRRSDSSSSSEDRSSSRGKRSHRR